MYEEQSITTEHAFWFKNNLASKMDLQILKYMVPCSRNDHPNLVHQFPPLWLFQFPRFNSSKAQKSERVASTMEYLSHVSCKS